MQKHLLQTCGFLLFKLITDSIFINLSFGVAYFIKFNAFHFGLLPVNVYFRVLIVVTFVWLIVFNLGGLYKLQNKTEKRVDGILAISFAVTTAAFITLMIVLSLYREATYAIDIIFYAWFSGIILVNISRSLIWIVYCRGDGNGKK